MDLPLTREFTPSSDMTAENCACRQAEADLQRSQSLLAEAHRLGHSGSWTWHLPTGTPIWSAEHFRLFGCELREMEPTFEAFFERLHPEDRPAVRHMLENAVRDESNFESEFRIILPDGSIRHLQTVGRPIVNSSGIVEEFFGTTLDITARKQTEKALRDARAELARITRLTTMGELLASIAHEINQPLAAVVTNAQAGLRWLDQDKPDLDEIRRVLSSIVSDGTRISDEIRSLRALANKTEPQFRNLDIDEAIRDLLAPVHSELLQRRVGFRSDLRVGGRHVFGDRIQLQQVLMNLIKNGIEAMDGIMDRPRLLTVSSEFIATDSTVLVRVEDTGIGIDPTIADRIFGSFFTTKPHGMGMGLSICRSIVAAHGGDLWASARLPHGTAFRFTVPTATRDHTACVKQSR
jgi:PAS domain S-box-containing protein